MSEELSRKFESALQIIQTPTQFNNPYTGNIETRTPKLPEYVTSAISARQKLSGLTPKVTPPNVEVPGAVPTGAPSDIPAADLPALQQAAQNGDANAQKTLLAAQRKPSSLWGVSQSLTGPVSAFQAGAARVPGQGGSFSDVTQARSYANTAIDGLVSSLRTTDRFGNTEREEIKKNLGLQPQLFDDPAALRNRLIGISEFLEQEKILAERQLQNENLPVELRKAVATRLEEMKNGIKILGIPPKIYSLEEAAKLGPKVEFLWNGTTPMRTKDNVR